MRCPRCQHESPSSAKFCPACGARLAPACAGCGTELPAGAKFCLECGEPASGTPPPPAPRAYTPKHLAEKILAAKSALEGERKQVTVLFADVKGSMDLTERLDPEVWHGIMDRFLHLLADGVHRFEGTVNQFTGDGIMALFGAPIAHEDHALRACYAALHLRDELRRYAEELTRTQSLGFAVRMGLNSGEVVVGRIGDDLRMDYTALGHTVGLAARMEQLAEAGTVYLTEHTARLVEGFFLLHDLGPLRVKGMAEPLRVQELEGLGTLRTRLEVSRGRGFSRLVGRGDESGALDAALARAAAGNGLVVGMVADPGVGKSRLCFEFVQRARGRGVSVHETHCVSHGRSVPFLPLLELLRAVFGIAERDGDQAAREKVASRLLALDRAFERDLPLVFDFLGAPDPDRPVPAETGPDARRHRLLSVVKRMVHALARQAPVVFLVEDLHWIDGGSEAFLRELVEAVPGTRMLLLVTFRPEYHARWMQRSYYEQLPLMPLGDDAAAELVLDLVGEDPSVATLAARIRERTRGNPFFVEEIVQSLVDAGVLEGAKGARRLARSVEEVVLPPTVRAVLAARIDRLDEREKSVLQAAAVIGKTFPEPLLRRVVQHPESELAAALHTLTGSELLYEQALGAEAEYVFKHPLTQEVAYASQLAASRARVHAEVARSIAELYPHRLDEWAAILAHHWEAAGEHLEAARWSRRAARWVGRSSTAEAVEHWRKVVALLFAVPESPEATALGLSARVGILGYGWRLGLSEEEAETAFTDGERLAKRSGDTRSRANLLHLYGIVRGVAGHVGDHLDYARRAADLAWQTGDPAVILNVQTGLMHAHLLAGLLREALALTEPVVERRFDDFRTGAGPLGFSPYLYLLMFRGHLLILMGRPREARQHLDRAASLAEEHGAVEIASWVPQFYVELGWYTGDAEEVLWRARSAVEIAEKIDSAFARHTAYMALGQAHALGHSWSEAISALETALSVAQQTRTGLGQEASLLAVLAEAHRGAGDLRVARETAESAIAVARQRGNRFAECEAQLVLARALIRREEPGSTGAIEAALARALELVDETGGKILEPSIRLERAELERLRGDEDARQRELREAHRLCTEMGATARAERLARELERRPESTS